MARALAALSAAGIGVSAYLTWAHYASASLACAEAGVVNCEAVTTSNWSMVGPIPVALLGLIWFVVIVGLSMRVATSSGAILAWSGGGLLFVFYLVFTELFLIGAICLWCTVVHILVVAIFLLVLNAFLSARE